MALNNGALVWTVDTEAARRCTSGKIVIVKSSLTRECKRLLCFWTDLSIVMISHSKKSLIVCRAVPK